MTMLAIQNTFVDQVHEAEEQVLSLARQVDRLAYRLCGYGPEADQGEAYPPRSETIFDGTKEAAQAIIRSVRAMQSDLNRIEASLPEQTANAEQAVRASSSSGKIASL